MTDWSKGNYEQTAAELHPVAEVVVDLAAPAAGERVLDVACGTGNAALLAAARDAEVIGLDSAERLVTVAARRGVADGVFAQFRVADAMALPIPDASVDVVLSVFGVVFASDGAKAMSEVARVLRPGGRAYVTAWVPAGPINAMIGVIGRAMGPPAPGATPPKRFAWSDSDAVGAIAAASGLAISTTRHELEIRAASPEAYVDAGREHPMAVDMWPTLERRGLIDSVRREMIDTLAASSEDPPRLLIHSPYVVHTFRR